MYDCKKKKKKNQIENCIQSSLKYEENALTIPLPTYLYNRVCFKHRVLPRWAERGPSLPAARPDSAGCSASGSCPPSPWSSLHVLALWPALSPSWWCPSDQPPASSPAPAGLSPAAPPGSHPVSYSPETSQDRLAVGTRSVIKASGSFKKIH